MTNTNPLMPLLRSSREEAARYRDKCIEYQYRIEALEGRLAALVRKFRAAKLLGDDLNDWRLDGPDPYPHELDMAAQMVDDAF